MKKIFSITMVFIILFTAAACGSQGKKPISYSYKVPSPLVYPDYTFDAAPDSMQLRTTAVKAVRDLLSVQWCTEKTIEYRKLVANKNRKFTHEPGKTYGGVPYSDASTGLFQFLEYYDFPTGNLTYPGTADEMRRDLGATCADSLLWAWTTVCNSVTGAYHPVMMTPANGYIPVGNYTIQEGIKTYNEFPTYAITKNNTQKVMLESYSQILPADIVISTPENHAMMVVEKPHVEYLDDKSIDPENSYVLICDQYTGSQSDPDDPIFYRGRFDVKYTFTQLFDADYIPLTAAEFTGAKTYDKANVTTNNETCTSLDNLASITVESNYPLAVINIISIDKSGNEAILAKKLFTGKGQQGVLRTCNLSDITFQKSAVKKGFTIKVEVVVSTGERFNPIEFKV